MAIQFGKSGCRAPIADELSLARLRSETNEFGLLADGQADRFGAFDTADSPISPDQLIALLFDYLVESRKWTGGAARSVATSYVVDRAAGVRGLPGCETLVNFKYIGESINEDKIVIGGEKSAKLPIKGDYPKKDGIVACLLATEAVASCGARIAEQLTSSN